MELLLATVRKRVSKYSNADDRRWSYRKRAHVGYIILFSGIPHPHSIHRKFQTTFPMDAMFNGVNKRAT